MASKNSVEILFTVSGESSADIAAACAGIFGAGASLDLAEVIKVIGKTVANATLAGYEAGFEKGRDIGFDEGYDNGQSDGFYQGTLDVVENPGALADAMEAFEADLDEVGDYEAAEKIGDARIVLACSFCEECGEHETLCVCGCYGCDDDCENCEFDECIFGDDDYDDITVPFVLDECADALDDSGNPDDAEKLRIAAEVIRGEFCDECGNISAICCCGDDNGDSEDSDDSDSADSEVAGDSGENNNNVEEQ